MEKLGLHCLVSGRVQGVGFRAATQTQAQALNITGSVKNLPDGRVEVIAYGDSAALEQLKQWLHQGPTLANVSDVECYSLAIQEFTDFHILY